MKTGSLLRAVARGYTDAKKLGVYSKVTDCWDSVLESFGNDAEVINCYCFKRRSVIYISCIAYMDVSTVRRTMYRFLWKFLSEAGKRGLTGDLKKLTDTYGKGFTKHRRNDKIY